MSPETVHALRRSFQDVEAHGPVAALIFYRRLFELDPALRPLFKNDIESQAQKLTDTLAALLALLGRAEELQLTLEELGARHATYGVKPEHYGTVGAALLGMLGEVLGEEFTPELRRDWTELYGAVSTTMLAGAAKAAVG